MRKKVLAVVLGAAMVASMSSMVMAADAEETVTPKQDFISKGEEQWILTKSKSMQKAMRKT